MAEQKWIKPSEVECEGQYLVALRTSDYLRVHQVYSAPYGPSGRALYVVADRLGELPPPRVTDQFSDEDYRFFGPVLAPYF